MLLFALLTPQMRQKKGVVRTPTKSPTFAAANVGPLLCLCFIAFRRGVLKWSGVPKRVQRSGTSAPRKFTADSRCQDQALNSNCPHAPTRRQWESDRISTLANRVQYTRKRSIACPNEGCTPNRHLNRRKPHSSRHISLQRTNEHCSRQGLNAMPSIHRNFRDVPRNSTSEPPIETSGRSHQTSCSDYHKPFFPIRGEGQNALPN